MDVTPTIGLHWLKVAERGLLSSWRSLSTNVYMDRSTVSCWRILLVNGRRGSTTPAFHLLVISGGPMHSALNHRRLRFSSHRCPGLERSATGCHVRTFATCLPQAPKIPYLQVQLSSLTDRTVVVSEQWYCAIWHALIVLVMFMLCLAVKTRLREPRWAWGEQLRGMWSFSLQYFDTVA